VVTLHTLQKVKMKRFVAYVVFVTFSAFGRLDSGLKKSCIFGRLK